MGNQFLSQTSNHAIFSDSTKPNTQNRALIMHFASKDTQLIVAFEARVIDRIKRFNGLLRSGLDDGPGMIH